CSPLSISSFCLGSRVHSSFFFFFNDPATTELYTLSLHDALPIFVRVAADRRGGEDHVRRFPAAARGSPARSIGGAHGAVDGQRRSEEHTSELQSHLNLVCRLLLEKKKKTTNVIKNQ